jgi:hypothetical protein
MLMPPLPPNDLLIPALLRDVLAPLLLAACILFLCAVWRRQWLAQVGAVVALLAGLALGNWLRDMLPWLPEKQSWHWLLFVAVGLMLIGLLMRLHHLRLVDRWALCAAGSLAAAWLLMPREIETFPTWVVWIYALTLCVQWLALDALAKAAPGGAVPLGLAVLLFASGTILLYASSGLFCDIAIITAASLAGIARIAWLFRADVSAAAPGGLAVLTGLLFAGNFYLESKVPRTSFLLPALAPLGALLVLPLLLLRESRWRSLAIQLLFLALMLVPATVAVVLAMRAETLSYE